MDRRVFICLPGGQRCSALPPLKRPNVLGWGAPGPSEVSTSRAGASVMVWPGVAQPCSEHAWGAVWGRGERVELQIDGHVFSFCESRAPWAWKSELNDAPFFELPDRGQWEACPGFLTVQQHSRDHKAHFFLKPVTAVPRLSPGTRAGATEQEPALIPPLTPLSWRRQRRCPSGPWAEAACHAALSPLCPGHRHRVTCSSYSERAAGMVRDPLRLQPPALLGSPFWGRGERPEEPAYRAYDSRPQEEGRAVFGGDRSCPYQASSRVTGREPTQCPGTELPLSWTALLVVGSVGSSCGPSLLSFLPVNISIHFLPLLVRWSWDFQFLTMSETFLGKHLMAVARAQMASSGHPRTPPARSAQPSSLCQEQRESEIIAAKRKTPARLFFAASG